MRYLFPLLLACNLTVLTGHGQPRRPTATRPPTKTAAAPVVRPPTTGTTDPLNARFDYQDVARFWRAFDAWQAGARGNPFDSLY